MTVTFPHYASVSASELVRFVRPGPRYTSYPPATEFVSSFGVQDGLDHLRALRDDPDMVVSLYSHVPYCTSLCWYCGCNVTVSRDRGKSGQYVDLLVRELDLMVAEMGAGRPIAELSLGGGSPNFLPSSELARLVGAVRERFTPTDDIELGIELDPRETEAEQVAKLAELGFTRVSVGVQDFADAVQVAIHREQSAEQTGALIAEARKHGFGCVNADLVYGLPAQTPESFAETLDIVIGFQPDRIAMFGYAHLPQLRPHQKLVERHGAIPDTNLRAELLSVALERYEKAGYVRIGLDHFAKPEDSLVEALTEGRLHRNFQGYVVKRGTVLLGVGASAITDTGGAYWQNHVDLDSWSRAVEAGQLPVAKGCALDDDDQVRRWVIMRLMCDNVLDLAAVDERFGIRCEDYFATELAKLEGEEFHELCTVDREARRITATPIGSNLIRNVCMTFDRYLKQRLAQSGDRPRFSPTL